MNLIKRRFSQTIDAPNQAVRNLRMIVEQIQMEVIPLMTYILRKTELFRNQH